MSDITPLLYGLFMATIDVFMLAILKLISTGAIKNMLWMALPTLVYALQPWIFLQSLRFESMIVMNLLWDLISDVLVTANGVLYFKETLSRTKTIGVVFSILGIFLMSCEKAGLC
jgi:multidrug transporter EmrE-like cation transporter